MSLLAIADEKVMVSPNCQCFARLFVLVLVLVLDQLTRTRQQSIDRHPRSRAARATQAQKAQLLNRQTVDAIVDAFHRLAADGYKNFAMPNRPNCQVALSNEALGQQIVSVSSLPVVA